MLHLRTASVTHQLFYLCVYLTFILLFIINVNLIKSTCDYL
jgi:hypothetical protein